MSAKVKIEIDKACNHDVKSLDKVTLSKRKKDKASSTTVLVALAMALTACQAAANPAPSPQAVEDRGQGQGAPMAMTAVTTQSHEVIVTIFTKAKGCGHHVPEVVVEPELKKAKDDLSWDITNTCGLEQKVLVCAYRKKDVAVYNPFEKCKSKPDDRDIGKVFPVAGKGGKARLDCRARDEGGYLTVVLVGRVGQEIPKDEKCPSELPAGTIEPDLLATHRLGVEILK